MRIRGRAAMGFERSRAWVSAGLAAAVMAAGAPALAQPVPGAAAQAPPGAQTPGAAVQQRRAGGGGGGGGGRPQTQPLGDGPWDVTTEQGRIHVTVVTKDLERPWGLQFLPNG